MSIQRYKHFLAVADGGGFNRGAAQIGMKQPPLSQSIRRLERDLGVALFERTSGGVKLTRAGKAFLPEARAAVTAVERAQSLARAAANAREPVRVGVVSVALWETLPEIVRVARSADIALHLEQATTPEQLNLLAEGRLDLGLLAPPFDAPPRLKVIPLANEPVWVAFPAHLTRPKARTAFIESIANNLIMFPRSDGPVLYDAIMTFFKARGLKPRVVQQSPRMLTTLALIAAGRGISFVPAALARKLMINGVAFQALPAGNNIPTWPIALAHMPLAARSETSRLLVHWRRAARFGSSAIK